MAEASPERRLAAIVSADVVGYSRLMGEDETGTLIRLTALRRELIEPQVKGYGGRIVKLMGDGILADFPSVVDALACAVKVQHDIAAKNENTPENQKIVFRIGIHLGDILIEENDIYGDGVNIAARLEPLAEPGGICLSQAARNAVGNKLPLGYEDMGAQQLKNIAEPVLAYQVRVPGDAVMPAASGERKKPIAQATTRRRLWLAAIAAIIVVVIGGNTVWIFFPPALISATDTVGDTIEAPELPDKPSIAVLPFANISDDPEQEYFSDGITEDLITDLSKLRDLFVIARSSSFVYKGRATDVRQIGKALGVRYVLEGSVRKAGDQVRISTQLIDTSNGHHLWAERYDRDYSDIFQVQDEVVGHIVEALALQLTAAEQQQLARIPTANLEAYDYYLRAEQSANSGLFALPSALAHYRKAIALDPGFADAYAGYAWTALYTLWGGYDMVLAMPVARKQAYEAASRALALDPNTARAYAVLSALQLLDHEHDQALQSARKAVTLAPGSAEAHLNLGVILAYSGQTDAALAALETALRLNPQPAPRALFDVGFIRFTAGLYEQALAPLEQTLAAMPGSEVPIFHLAATYAQLDRLHMAKAAIDQVLRLFPHDSVALMRISEPYARAEDLSHFLDALRKAGLPEWPYDYQGSKEDRLDGGAIKALAFGQTWTGSVGDGLPFIQQVDADGNVAYRSERSFIIGAATVEGDQLCLRFEADMLGRKNCGYVYRNPDGRAGKQNEYVYVNALALRYFSVMP